MSCLWLLWKCMHDSGIWLTSAERTREFTEKALHILASCGLPWSAPRFPRSPVDPVVKGPGARVTSQSWPEINTTALFTSTETGLKHQIMIKFLHFGVIRLCSVIFLHSLSAYNSFRIGTKRLQLTDEAIHNFYRHRNAVPKITHQKHSTPEQSFPWLTQ